MNIAVIGLGLMGGSLAAALHRLGQHTVFGVDCAQDSLDWALEQNYIDHASTDAASVVGQCGVVFFAVYPRKAVEYLHALRDCFKKGALVTDLCGLKKPIHEAAQCLTGINFVGGHPMAGKECWGHTYATPELFQGANYILTPGDCTAESLDLLCGLVKAIGARVKFSSPEQHDHMIAYTSQMAHVLAAAITESPDYLSSLGFEGGSFRDLTRVARLNHTMWPELFCLNRDALCQCLDRLAASLGRFSEEIRCGDEPALSKALYESTLAKEAYAQKALALSLEK